jgi:hypothetical protein
LQTTRIRIPVLHVISNVTANGGNATTPLASWPQALAAHEREADSRLVFARAAMALPIIFALFIIGRAISMRFFSDFLAQLRWRSAARRAGRQIESVTILQNADHWDQLLARFLSRGLQRTISRDIESIRSAFAASPFSEESRSLMQAMQELEFGPNEYRHEEKVRRAAEQFFLEVESQR